MNSDSKTMRQDLRAGSEAIFTEIVQSSEVNYIQFNSVPVVNCSEEKSGHIRSSRARSDQIMSSVGGSS